MSALVTTWRTASGRLSAPQLGIAFGIAAAMIWGANQAFARLGVQQGLSPFDIAALRFGVAALILAPHFIGGAFRRVGLWRALALATLIGPIFFLLNVSGYLFAPLAHGALILPATFVVAGLALAAIVNKEKPTAARIAGAGIIIAGLALVSGVSATIGGHANAWIGDSLFAIAALLWAGATVLGPRWSLKPLDIAAVVAVISATTYLPVYLLTTGGAGIAGASISVLAPQILVHGVLAGVGAVFAFTRSVQLLGPSKAAVFPALVPVFAMTIGAVLFGELPTGIQLAGLAVVMTGLLTAIGVLRLRRGEAASGKASSAAPPKRG